MSDRAPASLWSAALLVLLVGCEPMPSSGQLLAPVAVAPEATGGVPAPPAPVDPLFADLDRAPVVISSESLRASAPEPPPALDPVVEEAAPAAPPVVEPPPVEVAEAPPAPPVAPPAPAVAMGAEWPLRLVRTLPETQPPRAILGLADGRELVVWPGMMVPEQNLVVIAVGRSTLQVARISSQGDHAVVSQQTLTALY